MLVDYQLSHNSWVSGAIDVQLNRLIDPDIDFDVPGIYGTTDFERDPSSGFTTATGPSSGWTVGWGPCQTMGPTTGGAEFGEFEAGDALCDPDGVSADILMGFHWTETVAAYIPMEAAFVMSIGATQFAAEDEWLVNGEDFCGDLWDDYGSTVLFTDCSTGGGGVLLPGF
jgi:hypothetical protein